MAREKRTAHEGNPEFVWQSDDSTQPRAQSQPQRAPEPEPNRVRGAFPVGRVLIAGTVVAVLAGGTLGVVDHSSHPADAAAAGSIATAALPAATVPNSSPSLDPSPHSTASPTLSASASKATATPKPQVVTVVKTVSARPSTVEPKPLGAWQLDGNALDASGLHDGIASDVSFSGGAAVFTGSNSSFIDTSATVLNTGAGASFTVSAWVRLTSIPDTGSDQATAVSQDAGIDSAFYLQYFGNVENRWAFARMDTDTDLSNVGRAFSTSVPKLNTWTHLVGVYEASNSALYLYVDGDLQGTATESTPFASSGDLVIGRARYSGKPSAGFTGDIKDVKVFNQALSAAQVEALS